MRLIHNLRGVSGLILIVLLLVSFIVGALLSYIWTMGSYAPQEFHLPSLANVTIEKAEFFAENATFFNVTVLNPSYSRSPAKIEHILMSTEDGALLKATSTVPSLPHELTPGSSQTFQASLTWGNYTGQTVNVIALVADGSGATFQARTPFMNLTVSSVDFYPGVSVTYFNVTIESTGAPTFVDIKTITVNRVLVPPLGVAPALAPYRLQPNSSVTFRLERNWTDLQGKPVTVVVNTLQGYSAESRAVTAPTVVLSIPISGLVFNLTDTLHFNVTIHNGASPAKVDISQVTVSIPTQVTVTITGNMTSPPLPQPLQPNSDVLLTCSWDWSGYHGQNATVTVKTLQGFVTSAEVTIP